MNEPEWVNGHRGSTSIAMEASSRSINRSSSRRRSSLRNNVDSMYGPGYLNSSRGFAHEIFSRLEWAQRSSVPSYRDQLAKQAGGALSLADATDVEEFAPLSSEILRNFEELQNEFLLFDNGSSMKSPQDKYVGLSQKPVGGLLAAVRLWQSPHIGQADGSWSKPVITVLAMPSVVERGTPVIAEDAWPGSSGDIFLNPGAVPRPDGPMLPISFTLASDTRAEPNEDRCQSSYIEDPATVFCLNGESALEPVGIVPSTISASDKAAAGSLVPLWDTQEQLSARAPQGAAFASDSSTSGTVCCMLPRVLMLPETHDLPVGQMWDPSIGFERFLHSIESMAGNSDASPALWPQGPLFREWFAHVASHPEDMAIDIIPRSAIAASLSPPSSDGASHNISQSMKYLDDLLAYRLHRDWILASSGDVRANRGIYLQYEERAWAGSFPADGYMGGSPAPLCADMWYLRPPAIPMWWDLMKLNSFMEDDAVAPNARKYAQHRILPGEPAPRIAIDADGSPDEAAGPPLRLSTVASPERRTLSASMISHRFLQQYVEECVEEIPLSPELVCDPNQSHKPFDLDARPRSKDGIFHRYGRQMILFVVLAGSATFGLLFSTFGNMIDLHDRERQPFFLSILQWLAMCITFPHWIPSIMSIFTSEPPHRFTRTNVPIILRWITRGDDNSKVTVIGVEAANKIIRDQGLDNFRIEIVTDSCVSVEQYDSNGEVRMRYDPRKGTDVADKKRVKSPLLVQQEQLLLPEYVYLIVCPDKFKTRCGTEKKGKALYYASLWNKVLRSRKEFGEKVDVIVTMCNSGNIARARYKAASLHDEANELREELLLDLGEKTYYHGKRATQELTRLEEVLDGRMLELSTHLARLPKLLSKVFSDESQDADLLTTAMHDLQSWSMQIPLNGKEEEAFDFYKLDSQIFHLDEESVVQPDILWSLNENSLRGEMSWRLLQGHHTYADTFNTQGLTCGGFQARMAQFWDAIRAADDGHRWATQLRMLQRIIMGAKGSNNKQSQAIEQKRGYSFNGGEATNITEDACQAFTITPAIKQFRREIEAEIERLASHYSQTTVLRGYENEPQTNGTSGSSVSRRTINFNIDTDAWLSDIVFDLKDIARTRGASVLLKPRIDEAEQKLNAKLGELQQLSIDERKSTILNACSALVKGIDKSHRDFLGWKDAYWLTGKVREQSCFSYKDFVLQRRRWFTGLLALWREHKYIGKNGHYMVRWGVFGIVMMGWALMPISLFALIISLLSTLFLDNAADPATGVVASCLGATYIYLYGYGSYHQFKRSVSQKLMAALCWITCITQVTSWLAEAPIGALAVFAPDMSFVVVPKDRAVVDIVSDDEMYPDSMGNLKAQEEFQIEVSEAYEGYRSAAIKAGPTISPLSREEFVDALPKRQHQGQP